MFMANKNPVVADGVECVRFVVQKAKEVTLLYHLRVDD